MNRPRKSNGTATFSITTHSAEETRAQGLFLGRHLRAGDVVRLEGELGAGKTTFVQGVVAALGSTRPVTSPTFTLVNEYQTASGLTVLHLDAYRLGFLEHMEHTVDTFGLGDLLEEGGVLLVEWSEHIAALLPTEGLTVHFAYGMGDDQRMLRYKGAGVRGVELINALKS